jgi:uncharacterized repeat protein (TIGR02543 family)
MCSRATMLLFVLAAPAWAEDPVHFADPLLQAAVEAELWIVDPTPSDMLAMTSLSSQGGTHDSRITDLTGLEYATNLTRLWLPHNDICDLTPLSGLTNLEDITLNNNTICSLSPLSGLHKLRWLDVHDSGFSDISCLASLENLELLIIRLNKISDISVLASMTSVHNVDLYGNDIVDMSPLTACPWLETIDLRENPLNASACAIYIPQILANNPGISFQYPLCVPHRLVISSTVGGAVINPGEGEFLFEEGTTAFLEAKADPGFVFIGWSGTDTTTQNPLSLAMGNDQSLRANFVSVLTTIHVDDDAAADPCPGDATISDPKENGTLAHPFDQIQEAIEVTRTGATVFVHPGVYHERIDFLGKAITVVGIDPNDPRAGYPVLDGGNVSAIVSFTSGEDLNSLLRGFVITAGKARSGAAILCSASSPTIANCLIVGSRATDPAGAAILCTDSHGVFINCTMADNSGGTLGAGLSLRNSPVTITNSILWGNTPLQIQSSGTAEPIVRYSAIAGGWPGPGCFDAAPLFARAGCWTIPGQLDAMTGPDVPGAVWVMGDYHLQSQTGRYDPKVQDWVLDQTTSSCIDAGDPNSPVGPEPSPNGGIIDMGTYGGTAQASKSHSSP